MSVAHVWTREAVLDRVRMVVAAQTHLPIVEVTPTSILAADLGTDSLDDVQILMALEDAFDLDDLTNEDTRNIRGVADLVALVLTHVSSPRAQVTAR